MRVRIEEIQDKGLELNETIPADALSTAMETQPGLEFESASKFHALFKKISTGVLLHGDFSATVKAPCKRCGVATSLSIPVKFQLNLVPDTHYRTRDNEKVKPRLDADDGEDSDQMGTFQFEDAETEPFDGKTIHLAPIVNEQLALALPLSVLCRDDCKGVCMLCGQNLNEKECGCEKKPVDIRLAKLKDIKLN